MRGMLEAGFIFWGLFLTFGLIVLAYWAWLRWEERDAGGRRGAGDPQARDGGAEAEEGGSPTDAGKVAR